jgi:predicted nucleic acid-binding protein
MTEKYFVDTNIFVYAADKGAGYKHLVAEGLIERCKRDILGVVSTQVLQEFYVVSVGKLRMDPLIVGGVLDMLYGLEVVLVDVPLIRASIDCSILNQLSFWDALIVTAARKAACSTLWTEDLNHGQIIQGVRIENPFLKPSTSGPSMVRESSAKRRPRRGKRDELYRV